MPKPTRAIAINVSVFEASGTENFTVSIAKSIPEAWLVVTLNDVIPGLKMERCPTNPGCANPARETISTTLPFPVKPVRVKVLVSSKPFSTSYCRKLTGALNESSPDTIGLYGALNTPLMIAVKKETNIFVVA